MNVKSNRIIENKENEINLLRYLFGIGSKEYDATSLKEKTDAFKHLRDNENIEILKLAMNYVEYNHKEKNISKDKLLFDVIITITELLNKRI